MHLLIEIFWTFFRIGAFTVGGGYAMLPLIQQEVVEVHGWLSAAQFTDALALAATSPGPVAVNIAVYVGYDVAGVAGAVVGAFGIVFPAFMIMLMLVLFVTQFADNSRVKGAFKIMRPAVVGMIAAVVFSMAKTGVRDVKSVFVALAAFALLAFTDINPVLVLIAGAVCGAVFFAA